MRTYIFIVICLIFLVISCREKDPGKYFDFFLDEKTMLVNKECINSIEGEYFIVDSGGNTNHIKLNFSSDPDISIKPGKWILGWGCDRPLYDAGVENLREINYYNSATKTVVTGKLLRGTGYPENDRRIVFWNTEPSGFKKIKKGPLFIPEKGCNSFSGKGFIINDSINERWIMYYHSNDDKTVRVHAATSTNLYDWKPVNNGKPIMVPDNFQSVPWAGKDTSSITRQTAIITDAIYFRDKWYFIMYGSDSSGKYNIGIAVAEDPVKGPFYIDNNPIVTPGKRTEWDGNGCFFGKIIFDGEKFLLYYDGIDRNNTERLGLAISYDLNIWDKYKNNPVIDDHNGWNSSPLSGEPAYAEKIGNKIYIILFGAKKFKMGFWHNHITKRMYMDVSGNVNDNQLGLYMSGDGGKTFSAHVNNPVMVNDYSDMWENEHLGASLDLIEHNDTLFLFYQAKTSFQCDAYYPFLRIKTGSANSP